MAFVALWRGLKRGLELLRVACKSDEFRVTFLQARYLAVMFRHNYIAWRLTVPVPVKRATTQIAASHFSKLPVHHTHILLKNRKVALPS